MSSMPVLALENPPVRWVARATARRLLVVIAALAVAAIAVAAWYWPSARAPSDPAARAKAPQTLDAARAHALALARNRTLAAAAPSKPADAPPRAARAADASQAGALFATHSWYVPPPPPPPVAAAPPPAPTAPPFPYTFVGSFTPSGAATVYFLARADRVTDAHVGDRLDGVYVLESATPAGLVFNYLPLDIRQTVPTGAPP
ncbi:MAG: secretion system X translation initiation factor [Proteobacteria bacterium]|nr:secretion system X translation initiation factor [Pseudomonadota bacterium]